MKLTVTRYGLDIAPESPQDEAFLEEVLALRKNLDTAPATRRDAMGLSCWGVLEIRRREKGTKYER